MTKAGEQGSNEIFPDVNRRSFLKTAYVAANAASGNIPIANIAKELLPQTLPTAASIATSELLPAFPKEAITTISKLGDLINANGFKEYWNIGWTESKTSTQDAENLWRTYAKQVCEFSNGLKELLSIKGVEGFINAYRNANSSICSDSNAALKNFTEEHMKLYTGTSYQSFNVDRFREDIAKDPEASKMHKGIAQSHHKREKSLAREISEKIGNLTIARHIFSKKIAFKGQRDGDKLLSIINDDDREILTNPLNLLRFIKPQFQRAILEKAHFTAEQVEELAERMDGVVKELEQKERAAKKAKKPDFDDTTAYRRVALLEGLKRKVEKDFVFEEGSDLEKAHKAYKGSNNQPQR